MIERLKLYISLFRKNSIFFGSHARMHLLFPGMLLSTTQNQLLQRPRRHAQSMCGNAGRSIVESLPGPTPEQMNKERAGRMNLLSLCTAYGIPETLTLHMKSKREISVLQPPNYGYLNKSSIQDSFVLLFLFFVMLVAHNEPFLMFSNTICLLIFTYFFVTRKSA